MPASVSDVDGNSESRKGTISVFDGPPPQIVACKKVEEERDRVAQWVTARLREGCQPHEIGVFVRAEAQMDHARAAIKAIGVPALDLSNEVEVSEGRIAVGTMHAAKGLEFRSVVVMACNDEVIPLQERIENIADDADLEEVYDTERHLLYVACTRARDSLLVTGVEPVSEVVMAVLVVAISVIVRVDSINEKFPGGWIGFKDHVPNQTLCAENELARVGFMTPEDVKNFVDALERAGLVYRNGGKAKHLVVVDQLRGPVVPCDWIEFGIVGNEERVAACRLVGSSQTVLMRPEGWSFQGSLSQTYGFMPNEAEGKSLRFLRHEDGIDVYLNVLTGREVFVGRSADRG